MDGVVDPFHVSGLFVRDRDSPAGAEVHLIVPRFDQGVIREIHSRIDIATFIGQYVSLKKRGNDLVGLCPFHGEKTPSFHVHPDRGFFKCFGCGVGGDVITFVQKLENVPFSDAVRMLAGKAGVELAPEDSSAGRARSEREAIYEANAVAAAYFVRMLKSEAGANAREYCKRRGFSQATIEKFSLGFAPDGWNGLTDELRAHNIDAELAVKAGLLKPSQRGGYYDFYRNRLMVPTYATTGEVIAFGGRELGEGEPKYLNTSTTPVYTKGDHLYALNVARRAAATEKTLIVVEGYLDCIALHQAGFENTVAALGTAFTEKQATELRKYAENIFLCFDADAAGGSAATKAVDIASRVIEHTGSSVRVVALPDGEDPDSFVRSRGADAFGALLASAKPSIEFKLDPEIDRLATGFDSPSAIARKAEMLIRELTPREEWDRWRVYVAGRLKVNVDDLRNSRFLANSANFAPRVSGQSAPVGTRHASVHQRAAGSRPEPLSVEREVLSIMLEDPRLAAEYGHRIPPQRFRNEVYRRTYERIVALASELRDTADVFAAFAQDDETLGLLSSLGSRDRSSIVRYGGSDERRAHLDRVVERLERNEQEARYRDLDRALNELIEAGKPVPRELLDEFEAVKTKLKK
jgi:DNA primase